MGMKSGVDVGSVFGAKGGVDVASTTETSTGVVVVASVSKTGSAGSSMIIEFSVEVDAARIGSASCGVEVGVGSIGSDGGEEGADA